MQLTLGQALQVAKGYAAREVESAYASARDLCSQVEETPQLTAILEGLGMFYRSRGEFQTARDLGEHLLTLAQRQHDPERLAAAHLVLGDALFFCGAFLPARVHLDQALSGVGHLGARPGW